MTDDTTLDTRVPPDESPVECPDCGRPLESDDLLVLHRGIDHWERLDDDERDRFREVYLDESERLRTFRLKMLAVLVLLYFGFLFAYSYYSTDPFNASLFVTGWLPLAARRPGRNPFRIRHD